MQLTIHEASRMLRSKQLSSVELTRAYLERIQQVEPKVQAMVTVTDDLALEQARRADERLAAGDAGHLTGVPVVVKDILVVIPVFELIDPHVVAIGPRAVVLVQDVRRLAVALGAAV